MSRLDRTSYIARTANDLDHVNRVGIPVCSVLELRLKASGGTTSKSYLPEDAPPPKTAETGTDDFHFAPEKEKIQIVYVIDDPFGLVEGVKLELFRRFDKSPLWTLDMKTLGEDWWAHGKHIVKWDGRIVKPDAEQAGTPKGDDLEHDLTAFDPDKSKKDDFPDGYVTLEHTPYKFRLTIKTGKDGIADPIWAWTYWHILIKSIELDLGPEEAIPAKAVGDDEHKRNKAVRTKIDTDGKIPDDADTRRVTLISNVFKTSSGEMYNNTAFSEYEKLWEDGPLIPIIAKIRLADSADNEVKLESDDGAVALGNVRFLWDFEDPDEDLGQTGGGKPQSFIGDAIDYKKAKTSEWPKGDNCHKDKGGKRTGSKPVFPPQSGYDPEDALETGKFPFEVKKAKKRKWAVLSKAWREKAMKGRTGVVFQPSRIGGDDYKITVYLAYDKTNKNDLALDITDETLDTADAIKKASGKFQVWREVHLAKYVRKKNAIPDFVAAELGNIRGIYNKAYVEIEDKTVKSEIPTAGYNAIAKAKAGALSDVVYKLALDPNADHSSTASAFLVRDYNAFKAAVRAALLAADATLADPDTARDNWLTSKGLTTEVDYCNKLEDKMDDPGADIAKALNTLDNAADGVTIVQFDYVTSLRSALDGTAGLSQTNGEAISAPGATRNKCCMVLWKSALDTFVHEIGHHLFLPHFGPKPNSFAADKHDSTDLACVMTYNRPRPDFCGFCMLRLRGWSASKLSPTSASNRG